MYALVMMAAMSGSAEAPAFGGWRTWHRSCYACYGYACYGAGGWWHGWYHGCYADGGYMAGPGAYGWGCWGCYGCWGTSPLFQGPGCGFAPGGFHGPVLGQKASPAPGASKESLAQANRARVIVEVPADAKLYIDDQLMKTTSALRRFNTPELEKGQTYIYDLKAEVIRDGVARSETKRITIKVGDELTTSFTEESIAAASARGGSTAKR